MIDYLNILIDQNKEILINAQAKLLKSDLYKQYKKLEDSSDLENLILDEKLGTYLSFYAESIVLFIPNNKEDYSFHWDKEILINNEVFDKENFKHARISKINDLNTMIVECYNDRVELSMRKEHPTKKYNAEIYRIIFNNDTTIKGDNITSMYNGENFSFFRSLKNISLTNKEFDEITGYLLLNKPCSEHIFQKIKDYSELIEDTKVIIPTEFRLNMKDYKIAETLKKIINKI